MKSIDLKPKSRDHEHQAEPNHDGRAHAASQQLLADEARPSVYQETCHRDEESQRYVSRCASMDDGNVETVSFLLIRTAIHLSTRTV